MQLLSYSPLLIDNNPNLIGSVNYINPRQGGPCKKSRKMIDPVLASVISTSVLLTIVGFVLLKFTRKRRQKAPIFKTNKDVGFTYNNQYKKSGSLLYENRQFTYAEVVV